MGVAIKGNKNGIRIIIGPNETLTSAREELVKKFDETIDFFRNANFLGIESNNLSDREISSLQEFLEKRYSLNFIFSNNNLSTNKEYFQKKLSHFDKTIDKLKKITKKEQDEPNISEETEEDLKSKFIFENLRSGSKLVYDGNIIVFGDVNPGATLVASGNVIILGACRGTVYAGESSKDNKFIYATKLKPIQIKLNGLYAIPPDGADFIQNAIVKIVNNEIKVEQF